MAGHAHRRLPFPLPSRRPGLDAASQSCQGAQGCHGGLRHRQAHVPHFMTASVVPESSVVPCHLNPNQQLGALLCLLTLKCHQRVSGEV